jgi:hypothetical protein
MPLSRITGNSFNATANTNIDNGLLFLNPTTNRIGIANTNPGHALSVGGTVNSSLFNKEDYTTGETYGLNVQAQFGSAKFGTFSSYPAVASGSAALTYWDTNNGRIVLAGGMGGIEFPATQVASANANTLDDYEEGTWTPGITRASTSPSLTVSNSGRYVKIGKQVTIWGTITITAVAAQGTNVWIIASLPFTMGGQRGAMGSASSFSATRIGSSANITAVGDAIVGNYLYCQNADGSTTDQSFQAGTLYFTLTYEV